MKNNREFSDSDLLMFIDGEVDEVTAGAIKQSPAAMERVAALARSEERLSALLYQATRPDSLILGEYLLGLLDREAMAIVAQYLERNPQVQAEVTQMESFLSEVGPQLQGDTARFSLAQKARVILARLSDFGETLAGPAGSGQLAMAGQRGGDTGPLQYEAEEFQISIDVKEDSAQPGARIILGLLLGAEPAGWQVALLQDGRPVAQQEVDELGNFTLPAVQPGHYAMQISDGQTEVHIEALKVN